MSSSHESMLHRAAEALEEGDIETALMLCMSLLRLSPDHAGAHYLSAEAYREMGLSQDAEDAYRHVIRLRPDHSPAFSGLAAVLFDQVRFDASRTACLRALRGDDGNAEAYYWRAMLRERRGDLRGARRDYRRARNLAPTTFPMPVELDDARIDGLVAEILLSLHPTLQDYLAQVVISIEDVPEESICLQFDPPAPPGEILGTFSGVPIAERDLSEPWGGLPTSIVLFRRNLERIAWNRERLLEELRGTVFTEVGHFLGLGQDDLFLHESD